MRNRQNPNRSIGRPDPRLMPQNFVRIYSDPTYAGFTRQHEQRPKFREIRDGRYHYRSIGRPGPRPNDAGFTRQHPFQLPVGQRVDGQPSKVLCISYPPFVHVDEDMLHKAMIRFGEIHQIKTFYDRNFSLVLFRRVEEAQCAKEGLQGKLFNDPRIKIEYSSSFPEPNRDLLEYHPIPGRNVPSGLVAVTQENNSDEILWHGIIAKRGAPMCQARIPIPIGESIECEIPDIINCTFKKRLDKLTNHYVDTVVGFNILSVLPHTKEDFASYTKFLRYLTANDRAWVAEFADRTTLFLVPPSDFLKKVLKVDGATRIYGVIFKYAHHTPSGTSLPPENNQPQYVDAPRITSSQAAYGAMPSVGRVSEINDNQIAQARALLTPESVGRVSEINDNQIAQARALLTPELVATLRNMLPSSSVEGTAGASIGMSASDVAVAPLSWRYDDPQLQLGRHQDAGIAHGTDVLGHYGPTPVQPDTLPSQTHVSQTQACMPSSFSGVFWT